MLPHHVKEIERLRRQHAFMNTTTGGLLLDPQVIPQGSSLRVLDSGAADGQPRPSLPASSVSITDTC
jgi:hypothetical protein